MKVLVTGNRGYIGTVMVPLLVKAGHQVTGLDTDFYARCIFGEDFNSVPFLKKDTRDVDPADLAGFDAVIHLAALSNDPLGNLNPEITYDINWRGTVHLARVAKEAGVQRFLFSSSCSNYGAAGDNIIEENAELNPVTPYGISKVRAEQDSRTLAYDSFSSTYLRSATAYGASPRLRFDIVLNNLAAWAYTTGKIFLKGESTSWRPMVHVEDILRAFVVPLQAPRHVIQNQVFKVAEPRRTIVSEI